MNDSEIYEFLSAFEDFVHHAESEIQSYFAWQEAQSYATTYYEELAAKYEVPVDYILAEFVL